MIIEKIGNSRTQPYFGVVVAAFPTLNPPEIKMKHYIAKIAVVILSGFAVATGLRAGPSADDVGDAETFGHAALYMGAASGFVTLSTDPCPSPDAYAIAALHRE